jgi:hypothetical protein
LSRSSEEREREKKKTQWFLSLFLLRRRLGRNPSDFFLPPLFFSRSGFLLEAAKLLMGFVGVLRKIIKVVDDDGIESQSKHISS